MLANFLQNHSSPTCDVQFKTGWSVAESLVYESGNWHLKRAHLNSCNLYVSMHYNTDMMHSLQHRGLQFPKRGIKFSCEKLSSECSFQALSKMQLTKNWKRSGVSKRMLVIHFLVTACVIIKGFQSNESNQNVQQCPAQSGCLTNKSSCDHFCSGEITCFAY